MSIDQQLVLFFLLIVCGIVCEGVCSKFYNRKSKKKRPRHFTFARYFFLLSLPMTGTIITFFMAGIGAIEAFFAFAFLGPILEWCIGYSYQSIVGQKLWTYHRYAIGGNTSWLTIPFWGFAGILFFYLARIL